RVEQTKAAVETVNTSVMEIGGEEEVLIAASGDSQTFVHGAGCRTIGGDLGSRRVPTAQRPRLCRKKNHRPVPVGQFEVTSQIDLQSCRTAARLDTRRDGPSVVLVGCTGVGSVVDD